MSEANIEHLLTLGEYVLALAAFWLAFLVFKWLTDDGRG